MNYLKTSLNINKKYLKILLSLLIIGFFIGLIIAKQISPTLLPQVKQIPAILHENHLNFIFYHLTILTFLIILSFSLIGLIFLPIFFIYESICMTTIIFLFTSAFFLKGLIFSILYIIITKLVFIIVLIIITKKSYKIAKALMTNNSLQAKNTLIISQLKAISYNIIIISLYDVFLFFFGSKILSFFLFIIK